MGGCHHVYIGRYCMEEKRREDLETDDIESIWIEIDILKGKNFLVGCIHRPPDSSLYLPKDFITHLSEMVTKVNNTNLEIFLLGDINVNYLKKVTHIAIKDIFTSNGLDQLIKSPTRVTSESKTLIAVILTNSRYVQYTNVLPLSISDHDCVICVRKINYTKFPHRTVSYRDYSKYDHSSLAKDLEDSNWEPLYSSNDVNTCWYYLKGLLSTKFDHHAPKIQKRVGETLSLAFI